MRQRDIPASCRRDSSRSRGPRWLGRPTQSRDGVYGVLPTVTPPASSSGGNRHQTSLGRSPRRQGTAASPGLLPARMPRSPTAQHSCPPQAAQGPPALRGLLTLPTSPWPAWPCQPRQDMSTQLALPGSPSCLPCVLKALTKLKAPFQTEGPGRSQAKNREVYVVSAASDRDSTLALKIQSPSSALQHPCLPEPLPASRDPPDTGPRRKTEPVTSRHCP